MLFVKPHKYVFANNPAIVKIDTEGVTIGNGLIYIRVNINNTEVFQFSSYKIGNVAEFEISDILKPFVRGIEETAGAVSTSFRPIPFSIDYRYFPSQPFTNIYNGYAFSGGISNELLRIMNAEVSSIFESKFLNIYENFLFTTRTDTGTIHLYKEEIGYIFFLAPTAGRLTLSTDDGQQYILGAFPVETPVMVNLGQIAGNFSQTYSSISLSEEASGELIKFQIHTIQSENKYLLKFRNSYGLLELFLLTGTPVTNAEFQFEDSEYNQFDTTLYNFRKSRKRILFTKKITINTGFKSSTDLAYLIDVITSDEIYFIDKNGMEQKCLVTAESYSRRLRQTEPEDMQLTISFVDVDRNYSPFNHGVYPSLVLTDNSGFIITDNQFYAITDTLN